MLWAPLLGAGRFGSAFGSGALAATALLPTVAGALVAAVLLPWLLRTFCEFELSLGAAFAVTLGRSLASFAASLFVFASFRSAVAPMPAMFFLPQVLPRRRLPAPEASGPAGSQACPERLGAGLARAGARRAHHCGR